MSLKIDKNPVILVHGIWDTSAVFTLLEAHLRSQGWSIYSLDLKPNDGSETLEKLGEQLDGFIRETFAENQPLDLIGFSMGGLVSRYYLQRLGGLEKVQRFISISSPHHGTFTAYVRGLPGYIDMRPGSQFLQDLAQDVDRLNHINFTSIWTPFDAMIVPPTSSLLGIGEEVKVYVLFHYLMIQDFQAIQVIIEALKTPLKNVKKTPSKIDS